MRRIDQARRPGKTPVERACHGALLRRGGGFPLRGRLSCPTLMFVRRDGTPVFVEILKHANARIQQPQIFYLRELIKAGLDCYTFDPQQEFRQLELTPRGDSIQIKQEPAHDEV